MICVLLYHIGDKPFTWRSYYIEVFAFQKNSLPVDLHPLMGDFKSQ